MRAQDSVVSADPYTGTDNVVATGSYISSVLGVRLSTPLFGTGFNACIGARAAPATPPWCSQFQAELCVSMPGVRASTPLIGTGFSACNGARALSASKQLVRVRLTVVLGSVPRPRDPRPCPSWPTLTPPMCAGQTATLAASPRWA